MPTKNFVLYRHKDESGVSGTGVVAEGTQFSDGIVVMRWLGETASTNSYASITDVQRVHAHKGQTEVRFETDYKKAYEELIDVLNINGIDLLKKILPVGSTAVEIMTKSKQGPSTQ